MKKIHFVFYLSLLKFYHNEIFNITSFVLSLKVNDIKKYEVKAVLNSQVQYKKVYYLIKWVEYSDISNEWLSFDNIHADKCMKAFHKAYSMKLNSCMSLKEQHYSVRVK